MIRRPAAWIHGLGLCAILYFMGWYTEYLFLETAIVVILMYEIGFKLPLMDILIDHNEDLVRVLTKFFKPVSRRKKKRIHTREKPDQTKLD